jgi:DNA-directed RNA polymerase specialized sigma subunit
LDAKEKEFETWKGLVPYLIKRLSISDEDIVQEAYIALWHAVNDFDPNRGASKRTL